SKSALALTVPGQIPHSAAGNAPARNELSNPASSNASAGLRDVRASTSTIAVKVLGAGNHNHRPAALVLPAPGELQSGLAVRRAPAVAWTRSVADNEQLELRAVQPRLAVATSLRAL